MAIWFQLAMLGLAALISSSARAQDLVSVPVAIPAITPAAVTFAVARDRGYFREEGLDAQLIVMPSAIGTQALIGGNVKFPPSAARDSYRYSWRANSISFYDIQSADVLALR